MKREYGIQFPGVYDGQQPLPMLLDLHGWGDQASRQHQNSGTQNTDQDFVAVFPSGFDDYQSETERNGDVYGSW